MAQRKDAVRNRARLVVAARKVFAERGLDATLDEIAERAGVGTATAYRNFADKHELAAEVLAEATQQIATDATMRYASTTPGSHRHVLRDHRRPPSRRPKPLPSPHRGRAHG